MCPQLFVQTANLFVSSKIFKLSSLIFLKNDCDKWKKQPDTHTIGKEISNDFIAAVSKSISILVGKARGIKSLRASDFFI